MISRFLETEDGAVTVDWVVLTAALVGLGLAVLAVTSGGVENLSDDTATELASIDVGELPFGEAAWAPGALLSWTQTQWDDGVSHLSGVGDVNNSVFGVEQALALAEAGTSNPAHQLDAASMHIAALNAMGEDTSTYQDRYDAAYADYVANNG